MNVKGAVAILNTGSWNTYPEIVLEHERGSDSFTYNSSGQYFHTPPHLNHYYLEDMLQFLDVPTEWFYDEDEKKVYLWSDDGKSPGGRNVRGKVSTYALNITNCSHVTFANLTLFATTLWASALSGDGTTIDSLQFSSLNFSYPSCSRRMLRSTDAPQGTFVSSRFVSVISAGWQYQTETGLAVSYRRTAGYYGRHLFSNCSWTYADGPALTHSATGSSFVNNYFAYNDWSGADETKASGGVSTINNQNGFSDYFYRNTLYRNGVGSGYRPAANSTILLNHIANQCWGDIQHDGAAIQV